MKKITSLFLILVLCVAFTGCVYAEGELLARENIPVMTEEDGVATGLNKLGILLGTGNGLELEREVTRAEAVVLIFRMHYQNTGAIGSPSPEFSDLDNHWAYKEVTAAKKMGLVHGVGDGRFEPDRTVTGREFAKMVLSMLGYTDVNLDNAYEIGMDCGLLSDNFIKSVVSENYTLLRGDCARMMWSAFLAESAFGGVYYKKLIEVGKFSEDDFYGTLIANGSGETEIGFADRLDSYMPKDKNYMFSPLSIKMALGLAANGASGETKDEILKTLEITNIDEFNQFSKNLINKYSKTEVLNLNIANSIWINKDKTDQRFSNYFKGIATDFYNAQAETVKNANAVREINSWVNDKTNEKIPEIVDETDDFWAMIINALYFKGAWQNEFNESATKPDEFTNADGTKSKIDFMNKTEWLFYADTEDAKVVELPYKNVVDRFSEDGEYLDTEFFDDLDVSMYLLSTDSEINAKAVLDMVINHNQLSRQRIKLLMPKFKIEYETELNDILMAMGVTTAFDAGKADFSNMFDSGNMFFSFVLHKTYIDVDEKGTEAAAVTAIGMKATSAMPQEPIELKFDKPFHFIIRDNTSGEVLFMGRYAYGK